MAGAAWRAVCLLALLLVGGGARADDYPSRPMRVIAPFPPGGGVDLVTRLAADVLSKQLGQQFVVDNRPGAGANLGAELLAKAPPDGYTLGTMTIGTHGINPALYAHLPFDPVRDFTPIALLITQPNAMMVSPKLGVHSVAEFVALAKAKPGQLNFGTAGVGSLQHLACELFRFQAGVDMVHVPYKGGGPAMMDVAAGQAQMTMATIIQCLPMIHNKQLKPIGISALKRSPVLPDVPTIDESGLPGFVANNWWGVLAPAATPRAILDQLHDAINAILSSDETRRRFDAEGATATPMTRDAFAGYITEETGKWAEVVKQADIKAE